MNNFRLYPPPILRCFRKDSLMNPTHTTPLQVSFSVTPTTPLQAPFSVTPQIKFDSHTKEISVKKVSLILKIESSSAKILSTSALKEQDISLFWLPLCHMPSTSKPTLCRSRVKYRVLGISCFKINFQQLRKVANLGKL